MLYCLSVMHLVSLYMKFLFWNIQRKRLTEEIAELILESKCQLYAFAEASDETIEAAIEYLGNQYGVQYSLLPTPGCDKIKLMVLGASNHIALLNQNKDFSLIKIDLAHLELIVGFVHLPSKLHRTPDQSRRACEKLRNQIVEEEDIYDTDKSIVIGDFNVNPFEMPMISFSGMAATNGIDCSKRDTISCDGESQRLFYNPMWTLYADHKERPGSHRYIRTGEDVVSWHFLDQVIIRPALIDHFKFDALTLVKKTENYCFTNIHHTPKPSDHLPLMCEFEF